MSRATTVYGIRLKGCPEVRYVGLTYKALPVRLRQHLSQSGKFGLSDWLNANRERAEIFPIAEAENDAVAKGAEKLAIALCCSFGHRLFNRAHTPAPQTERAA